MKKMNLYTLVSFCMLFLGWMPIMAQNPKPFVIPELKTWKGKSGYFEPTEHSRIIYQQAEIEQIAHQFAADYNEMFGKTLQVVKGKPQAGDFYFVRKAERKLNREGYHIDINRMVTIQAPENIGLFWATRTLLQLSDAHIAHNLPKGNITDYPSYPVRGFMLDVGRKFFPISSLRDYVKVLSYYKVNTFQIHLNDNGFYEYFDRNWDKVYAAFRLECDTYPGLTSEDGFYTKAEFKDLQHMAMQYGVDIVPEIDSPAHALAFTHYMPELGSKEYGMDHLDISNPKVYSFMDALFEEYLGGKDPVFVGKHVNIGTDEYSNKDQAVIEQFRAYTDHYIRLVEKYGKQAWLWGALTHAKGNTPVKADDVVLTLWNTGFADPQIMKKAGYKMISMNDQDVYIVPAAGYYQDYLDIRRLYQSWVPAKIGESVFKANDPAILGGMFAIWNDHVGNGVSTYDVYHRFFPAMQTLSAKMWAGDGVEVAFDDFDELRQSLREAPGVNRLGRIAPANRCFLEMNQLLPNQKTDYEGVGYDYTVSFSLEGVAEKPGTVLFSCPRSTFYLSDPVCHLMGFSRDGYLYTFRYRIHPDKKVQIRIQGNNRMTRLYVDGKLIEELNQRLISLVDTKPMAEVRTLFFPLQESGDFKSRITDFKVYNYLAE